MLQFKNGSFKIMQIADLHEVPLPSRDTERLITLALERERPDLVIFTGDQLYGPVPLFWVGSPERNVKKTIEAVLKPIAAAGVPFAFTFGNHDEQTGVPAKKQTEFYAGVPGYLPGERRSEEDPGTLLLPVYGMDGAQTHNLLLVDSGRQIHTGAYEAVKPEQLGWIKEKLKEHPYPTLVFQHIPVPEYYEVLERASRKEKGAAEAFRTHRHEYYKLPAALTAKGGFLGETPAIPDSNGGEFETLLQSGCVKAIFVGHDHNNSFTADYKGITLAYTQGAGFRSYGPGLRRGVRIIELSEADPAGFSTRTVTYCDLTDEPLKAPLIPFVMDRLPTSFEEIKRIALVGGAAALAAGAAAAAAYLKLRGGKK